jgi:hypothetical protein
MLKRTLVVVILALAIPTVALAAKPQASTSKGKAAPKVTYILKGTFSNFAAASSTANGSVTINVTHSNYHARALVGQQLVFAVSLMTPTTLMGGTIINGARGTHRQVPCPAEGLERQLDGGAHGDHPDDRHPDHRSLTAIDERGAVPPAPLRQRSGRNTRPLLCCVS